ncbi:dephospho-CoA kinase [Parabacteroides sp. PF5-6]|uniref:dephospho-CoA kinase n=1 Tax=Parabacteroides sp. PF5-6 TaxID=1742403 RepID=UPI002405866A|nr:dephospho-CoA kinase [Parabacteroides sp. PF5-6]MDF9828966.1 dephospho-CoA kinase [Parabacteroides sp. PF5-6]
MIKIGITGGIGSGKTVVTSILEVMGIPVYIADEQSKRLTDTSPVIKEQLIALFGATIYTSEGLNRGLLASYIFNSADYLARVNQIIHPEVNRHFLHWTQQQQTTLCAIESAILFESGFDRIVDYSLMVYAPLALRIERACRRDGVNREEIERRINSQMPDEIKKERASFVVFNDNNQPLIPQIQEVITTLTPLTT